MIKWLQMWKFKQFKSYLRDLGMDVISTYSSITQPSHGYRSKCSPRVFSSSCSTSDVLHTLYLGISNSGWFPTDSRNLPIFFLDQNIGCRKQAAAEGRFFGSAQSISSLRWQASTDNPSSILNIELMMLRSVALITSITARVEASFGANGCFFPDKMKCRTNPQANMSDDCVCWTLPGAWSSSGAIQDLVPAFVWNTVGVPSIWSDFELKPKSAILRHNWLIKNGKSIS